MCPTHLILLDLVTRTLLVEKYRPLSSSLCNFLHSPCHLVPLRPKYSPQHPILKHPQPTNFTLSLRFSHNVSDQVSYPYKTTGKITVLSFLIFIFLGSKLEDKYSAPSDRQHSLTLSALNFFLNRVLIGCLFPNICTGHDTITYIN